MPWAGKECLILAAALPSGSPPTNGGQGEDGISPVTDEGEPVRLAKLVFIPDDEAKAVDGEEVSK